MSDKTVGVIGQKYEDRKTGKCGVLVSRDDKYKTLAFEGDDGKQFKISNSSFRSNWRKAKEEGVDAEPVDEEVETTEQEEVVDTETTVEAEPDKEPAKVQKSKFENVTEDEAIANFVSAISGTRPVKVNKTPDGIEIFADDVIVTRIVNNADETYNIAMLPDLFTLVDWRGKVNTSSIQYKTGAENYLGVILNTKVTCIPELLDIMQETVADINVYGYTFENEESEETTNGEDC